MCLNVNNIPLEVDVWNEIEDELRTGLRDVLNLRLEYSAEKRGTTVEINHPANDRISTKRIELNQEDSESLLIRLSDRFNFQWTNIAELSFKLDPGEIPLFTMRFYPRVNDASTLDNTKSRRDPITID